MAKPKKDDKHGKKPKNIKPKDIKPKAAKKKDKAAAEQPNLDELRQQLVKQAKKEGHIEQKAIFKLIPETPENAEALDTLYTELADLNLDITTADPAVAPFTDAWAAE